MFTYASILTGYLKMPKAKDKERILKAAGEKQRVAYKKVPRKLSADFSKKLCRQKETSKKYSVMKSKDLQPRLLYPAKLSFRMEGQIKCFSDKVKLKGKCALYTAKYSIFWRVVPCSTGFPLYEVSILGTHLYQSISWHCCERLRSASVNFFFF